MSVNAARQQTRASILDVSSEDFDATMKTNVYTPFWIMKAALPHLKPGSCIIGTISEQAYDPFCNPGCEVKPLFSNEPGSLFEGRTARLRSQSLILTSRPMSV
ncbi:SDR family oxidoreductase [Bradyrhizobium japonicum]|uniref:SDR family oxidoreductase n=1 Tax=Bradyrhizobium TaxID=374 RepID=UPI001FD8C8E7|nr:SDR family oxidoreductase [Bradyrhizobium japonicum]